MRDERRGSEAFERGREREPSSRGGGGGGGSGGEDTRRGGGAESSHGCWSRS